MLTAIVKEFKESSELSTKFRVGGGGAFHGGIRDWLVNGNWGQIKKGCGYRAEEIKHCEKIIHSYIWVLTILCVKIQGDQLHLT